VGQDVVESLDHGGPERLGAPDGLRLPPSSFGI
jgi:hypothetical protein